MLVGYSAAWALLLPPGQSADEFSHYYRAYASARLHLRGQPSPKVSYSNLSGWQVDRIQHEARQFRVPLNRIPGWEDCTISTPTKTPSDCQPVLPSSTSVTSFHGAYPPVPYLVLGIGTLLPAHGDAGLYVTRLIAGLIVCIVALMGLRVVLRATTRPAVLAVLLLGLPPSAFALFGAVSTSGLEIAAAFTFAVTMYFRPSPDSYRLTWLLSGILLATTRSTGPLYVLILLSVGVAIMGWRSVMPTRVLHRPELWLLGAAFVSTVAWEKSFKYATRLNFVPERKMLVSAIGLLPLMFRHSVAAFAWLDVFASPVVHWTWAAALLLLTGSILLVSSRRQRIVICALPVGLAALIVAVDVLLIRPTGFGSQARYTIPVLIVAPITLAALLYRNPPDVARFAKIGRSLIGIVVMCQLLAMFAAARRFAVTVNGPMLFWGNPAWSPILGWWSPTLLAVAGSLAALALPGGKVVQHTAERRENATETAELPIQTDAPTPREASIPTEQP